MNITDTDTTHAPDTALRRGRSRHQLRRFGLTAGSLVMMIGGLTAGTASAQTPPPEPGLPGGGAVEECGPPGTLIRQLVDESEFPETRFGHKNWGVVIQAECAPGNLP